MMTSTSSSQVSWALYALTIGAFGIGTTEFVIMGVLEQVAVDLDVSIGRAGLLISGYVLGAALGGVVIERSDGFIAVPFAAALVTLAGLTVAVWAIKREQGGTIWLAPSITFKQE